MANILQYICVSKCRARDLQGTGLNLELYISWYAVLCEKYRYGSGSVGSKHDSPVDDTDKSASNTNHLDGCPSMSFRRHKLQHRNNRKYKTRVCVCVCCDIFTAETSDDRPIFVSRFANGIVLFAQCVSIAVKRRAIVSIVYTNERKIRVPLAECNAVPANTTTYELWQNNGHVLCER